MTNPGANASPQSRNANSLLLEDSVNWLKGAHSLTLGGSFTQYDIWAKNSALLSTINIGLTSNDPALNVFSVANMPGSSATQQGAAANLYALLTGHVSSTSGDAELDEATGKYVFSGVGTQRGRQREMGFYGQDAWRVKPNMTLNLGLRYDVQQPFIPLNSLYSQANIQQCAACRATLPIIRAICSRPAHARHPPADCSVGREGHQLTGTTSRRALVCMDAPGRKSRMLGDVMGREGTSSSAPGNRRTAVPA